jgi:protein-S-isoprenylcysteine O-methyltransferase Ste14
MKLLLRALCAYLAGLLLVGGLLFLPAGTVFWGNAWLFCALLFVPMLILGVVLYIKAPGLLEKRLNAKEKQADQKKVVAGSGLLFLASFVSAGLDFRFGLTAVPDWLVIAASVILLLSYAMYAEVMRENAYLSRTVEVQEGQKVVDTGLYGVIRHPMYAATVFLFLSIPLVLGSWIAFVIFLGYPAAIVVRIRNEEEVLRAGLDGYEEYTKRVRWRLIPFVW